MASWPRGTKWASLWVFLLGCVGTGAVGCSAHDGDAPPSERASECVGTSAQELKVCAGPSTLKGIDVSYYQGTVDWAKVRASGRRFAFARVSDGVDHPDTKFARNWPAMKAAGIVRGAYQFFRPAKDVDAQVNLLVTKIAAAGGLEPGDLPPVLDLETDGGLPASTVVARAKAWLAKVEAAYGIKPIVYTAAFMSSIIGNHLADYPLWVANYGATCPTMPSGWSEWRFWQDSDRGSVPGVSGNVDTNLFNGTVAQLEAMTLKPPAEPPPAPPARSEPDEPTPDVPMPGAGGADELVRSLDDDQGATMGSAVAPREPSSSSRDELASAPLDPCR